MKIYCPKCGTRLKSEICKKCGSDNSLYYRTEKFSKPSRCGLIIYLMIAVAFIGVFLTSCVSCIVCPETWSISAKENRAAILEYTKKNYPEAKIVKEHYPSAEFNPTNNPHDWILFEFDGINFTINARDGQIDYDGYWDAKVIAQFNNIIQDGFLKPRGIDETVHYRFKDNYKEIYPYTGSLGIYIQVNDQGSTAREVGWLYDFYMFWKKEGAFLKDYRVDIDIYEGYDKKSYIIYYNDSEFINESDFYSAFKAGH